MYVSSSKVVANNKVPAVVLRIGRGWEWFIERLAFPLTSPGRSDGVVPFTMGLKSCAVVESGTKMDS